jgi:uroporphyrinogen decarboxylase
VQMRSGMTKWERIRATLQGEETDRTPVALWRHFPQEDERPDTLAAAALAFQEKYDWDFIKFSPTGTYGIMDWGAETVWQPNPAGVRTLTRYAVHDYSEWPTLKNLDVTAGILGMQNQAISLTAQAIQGQVPLIQTIFSPLTTALKLAGERVFTDLRKHPEALKQGLEIIADVTTRIALEAIRAGADGLFFATQLASYRLLNDREYQEFGEAYDLQVLQALRPKAEILMLHIHGEDIIFDLANRYPVDIVNWHDRITAPDLEEARQRTPVALAGGVNEWQTLQTASPAEIQTEVRQAIQAAGGRKLVIAPGCVIPYETSEERIWNVRNSLAV